MKLLKSTFVWLAIIMSICACVTANAAETQAKKGSADKERVFERFYRVDKSHFKETGGTGLGLSIVKHGVMFHKGRIELESELDKGTTIKIFLPRK